VQNSTTGQTRRLMVVAAVDQVKVSLQVPDRDCPWIRVGAAAKVTLEAQNRTLDGRITRSSNALDPQTRTMQVEIDLDNADRQLRPGDYVQVRIVLQKLDNASVVPVSAVYTRKNSTYLLLADGGVVRRQPARIRYDDGREMVVVKVQGDLEVPVDAADELIVSTKGEIAEGQRVKCTLLNSVPAPKAGGAGKGSKDGPRTQLPTPLHSAEIVDLSGGVERGWLPSWMAGAAVGRDSVAPAGHLHAAARSPRAGESSAGGASAY
jgi:Barrel-sandwich domain of CusB or HlyD membrane-fusion